MHFNSAIDFRWVPKGDELCFKKKILLHSMRKK